MNGYARMKIEFSRLLRDEEKFILRLCRDSL